MPQGPAHLHRLFGDDGNAWYYLQLRGFTHSKGIIAPPHRHHRLTQMEENAVDYLFMEWDWAYAPTRATETPPERSMLLSWGLWLRRASSGPLRVIDKHKRSLQMWWYCVAKYGLRKRWYYITGRRKLWDEGEEWLGDYTAEDLHL